MDIDWLSKIANSYERKARLYPALLALIPPIVLAACTYGVAPKREDGLIGFLATFGALHLVSSIVRELGKRRENSLYELWGGKPSTQLLRHRDNTIDPVTKSRYHNFLAKSISVNFPSPADEEANPIAADHVYQSGVKWLLEKTRDSKKFDLLFQENISYGFRRNCFGLKHISIAIAVSSILWPFFSHGIFSMSGVNLDALSSVSKPELWSLAVSTTMLFVWFFFFTSQTVKMAAFTYAEMLLRSCETFLKKK